MAVPFWRAVWLWLAKMITTGVSLVALAMFHRMLTDGRLDQAPTLLDFFTLAVTL